MNKEDLQKMIYVLKERDTNAVNEYWEFQTIEGRIELADGRGRDALMFIVKILEYLIDLEPQQQAKGENNGD